MKNLEKLTPYERAGMHAVISQEETETHYIDTIRTYDGATVVCKIPKHSSKEQKIVDSLIVRALTKFAHPDIDLDTVEYMKIII